MAQGPIIRYLPKFLNGQQVMFQEAPDIFRVDLSKAFNDGTVGIVYRRSPNMDDRDPDRGAIDGETIPGREVQGWIQVEIVSSGRYAAENAALGKPDFSNFLLAGEGAPCWIQVTECGSTECQGVYKPDGMMNGRTRYRCEQSGKTINYTSGWWLLAESYRGESWYAVHSKSAVPPGVGWICGHRGLAPLPTVVVDEVKAQQPPEDPYSTARVGQTPLDAAVAAKVPELDVGRPPRASQIRQDPNDPATADPLVPTPTPREPGGFCWCGLNRSK